jgi:multidrug efflux pump subunit AcrB
MSMVSLALRRPYTFIVMAMLIVLAAPLALRNMATDIFPEINIPVISIIWSYNGLPAQEMGARIAASSERGLTTVVSDIEHIESTSLPGITVIKVFLQPNANIQSAIAQTVASVQTQVRQLPPGITPPLVIKYSASSIPVMQLALSSGTLPEQSVFDAAVNTLRPRLVTIPGVAIPFPYGGKVKVISVDLDTTALQARGLSPADVVNAVNSQNLILPSGTAKLGETEYTVRMNGSPEAIAGLNDLPVRTAGGATTYLRDVAYVRDGFQPQTNIVRQDGQRGVLLSILKNGGASTLDIVSNLKAMLPQVAQTLPADVKIAPLFDQSIFVKAAIEGVVAEALIAAALTAAMVLLFLGNWRSTLIIGLTIPLSILAAILALYALGETLNIMTLGGLALSVGILVDQAIVTIENIERHLHLGKPLNEAIEVGAGEIGVPAFVSTLCICIVFVPMFFLSGVARYLFVPLAEAVVFAMIASYFLSRSLVPTLVMLLMGGSHASGAPQGNSALQRLYRAFDAQFEHLRRAYALALSSLLAHRRRFGIAFMGFCVLSCGLVPFLGRDFFPTVDAGQIRLHMRAPTGTRIEETARLADQVEAAIRQIVPKEELETVLDNLGIPNSGINLSYSNAGTIGTLDGEILLSLREGHKPTEHWVTLLRSELPKRFPGIEFFFQPADIVTQILNFGLPAQIDVRTIGYDKANNLKVAKELTRRIAAIPGIADAHLQQETDGPSFLANIDRTRAAQLGLNANQVVGNLNVSLSSSQQVFPNFWTDPANGRPYYIAVQTPEHEISSVNDLDNTPVSTGISTTGDPVPGLLSNVATLKRDSLPTNSNQTNIQPVFDVYASVQDRDLGGVARDIDKAVADLQTQLKPGNYIQVVGQIDSMNGAFVDLGIGILFAAVIVYLLMVVNYQNFGDPFVVILALPATFCGILTMLFITGTTLNVPSLMGAIMAVGVASANSILLVTFAREQQLAGVPARRAAIDAGHTRIRPVLMTAAAMIVGMIPMAIGGPGEEQNAALARAVIGGLLFATPTTLLVVPYLFALLRRGNDGKTEHGVFEGGV